MASKQTTAQKRKRPTPRRPLTVGRAGIPEPAFHDAREIPLAGATDRWSFAPWECVHRALQDGKAVSLPARQDEVEAALAHYHSYVQQEEDDSVPVDNTYCAATGRLWLWSALIFAWGPPPDRSNRSR